jgi:hypothetical protein
MQIWRGRVKSLYSLIFIPLLLVTEPVAAKTVRVRGEGAAFCIAWTQAHARNSPRQPVQDSWLFGYINAVAGSLELPGIEDVAAPFRNDDLVAWMDDYCQAHPDEEIVRAADALMQYLVQRSVQEKDRI